MIYQIAMIIGFGKHSLKGCKKMKRLVRIAFVLTVGAVVIMLVAGCEEQQRPSTGTKKSRLIAAENIELKKQLQQRAQEIERQKTLLEQCLQEKKNLEGQTQKNIKELIGLALKNFAEESAKLRKENERLKGQIEQLKKKLEEKEEAGENEKREGEKEG